MSVDQRTTRPERAERRYERRLADQSSVVILPGERGHRDGIPLYVRTSGVVTQSTDVRRKKSLPARHRPSSAIRPGGARG